MDQPNLQKFIVPVYEAVFLCKPDNEVIQSVAFNALNTAKAPFHELHEMVA
jgi:hypothetical protein